MSLRWPSAGNTTHDIKKGSQEKRDATVSSRKLAFAGGLSRLWAIWKRQIRAFISRPTEEKIATRNQNLGVGGETLVSRAAVTLWESETWMMWSSEVSNMTSWGVSDSSFDSAPGQKQRAGGVKAEQRSWFSSWVQGKRGSRVAAFIVWIPDRSCTFSDSS